MTNKFSVGDRVSFGGLRGTVESIFQNSAYPLRVKFEHKELGNTFENFTLDGMFITHHTKPLLKKLKKKKSDKVREIWVNIYPEGSIVAYKLKQDAAFGSSRCAKETAVRFVRSKKQ